MKALVLVGVVIGLATLVVGGLHTRAGRALWRRVSPQKSCPFGYDVGATPAERAASRHAFAASHRGTTPTPSRAADRFTLDGTSRRDIDAWAKSVGARCLERGGDLECANVPGFDAVWLGFEGDRVVALTQLRSALSPTSIHDAWVALERSGSSRYGVPTDRHDADLSRGPLQQAYVEWRFSDFYASARATNMGHGRYLLVDEYRRF